MVWAVGVAGERAKGGLERGRKGQESETARVSSGDFAQSYSDFASHRPTTTSRTRAVRCSPPNNRIQNKSSALLNNHIQNKSSALLPTMGSLFPKPELTEPQPTETVTVTDALTALVSAATNVVDSRSMGAVVVEQAATGARMTDRGWAAQAARAGAAVRFAHRRVLLAGSSALAHAAKYLRVEIEAGGVAGAQLHHFARALLLAQHSESPQSECAGVQRACVSALACISLLVRAPAPTSVAVGSDMAALCGRVPSLARVGDEPASPFGLCTSTLHIATAPSKRYGLAVSADERWLVVGGLYSNQLAVHALPGGERLRAIGAFGSGRLQFNRPFRMCFSPRGTILVAEANNARLQELTVEGVFVRFVQLRGAIPLGVDVHSDTEMVAVTSEGNTTHYSRVLVFQYGYDSIDSSPVFVTFGSRGEAPGELGDHSVAVKFTPDGSHVAVAEKVAHRVSLFTVRGEFVRCVGASALAPGTLDLAYTRRGECVVVDPSAHRVHVFSEHAEYSCWGVRGAGEGELMSPAAVALAGSHMYVLGADDSRVHVFV